MRSVVLTAEGGILGSISDLNATLQRINGRGYKAYNDIRGRWQCPGFVLCIDHVQGDPFAAPSRCRVQVQLLTWTVQALA